MTFLGFDPAAEHWNGGVGSLLEAKLERSADGRFVLSLVDDEGLLHEQIYFRADFLDALIAARTREAAA